MYYKFLINPFFYKHQFPFLCVQSTHKIYMHNQTQKYTSTKRIHTHTERAREPKKKGNADSSKFQIKTMQEELNKISMH